MHLPIASIKSDPELQPRAVPYLEAKVQEYALALEDGDTLPPIVVIERDGSYTIVIGHNRLEAHKRARRETIEVELIPDTGNHDLYWRVAAPSNSKHGAGYDEADRKAIFARYVLEGRHKLPDGQIRSIRKIAGELPFRVAHGTVDNWLKAHGIGSTDKRGGRRVSGLSKLDKKADHQGEPKPSQADFGRDQRVAELKAEGAVRAPGGDWRLPEPVETNGNPNTGKPTLSLAGPRETPSAASGATVTTPVYQPLGRHLGEISAAIARVKHHFPLVSDDCDRRAALEAIRGLMDHVTTLNSEFESVESVFLTAIPSHMKARPRG